MPKITASKTAVKSPRRPRCAPVYRVRNWAAYEAGLKQRGSLTFWITPQALRGRYHQGPTQRERPYTFFDLAIQTALMLRLVYALPLRQAGKGRTSPRQHLCNNAVVSCQCELRVESIAYLSFLAGSIISPSKEGARDGLAR